MKPVTAVFLAFFSAATAFAQSGAFLSKAEVEALAVGKKWSFSNFPRGNTRLDLRSGGDAYGINDALPMGHGGDDSGTWTVSDEAQLCITWRMHWRNRCFGVVKDGEKLKLVESKDVNGVSTELTVR